MLIAHTLEVFARLITEQAHQTVDVKSSNLRAACIFGVAKKFRETHTAPVLAFERRSYDRGIAALRAQLNETDLKAAWADGRTMTLEQVINCALEVSR